MTYAPIADHGAIGDLHTVALVSKDGTIDWGCLPRFDSPSTFGALLDDAKGGRWRIAPTDAATSEQRYLPGTNVLVTTFRADKGGVLVLTDFMPVGHARDGHSEIHRRVRSVRGTIPCTVTFQPRFDYAAATTWLVPRRHGVLAADRDNDVASVAASPGIDWALTEGVATAQVTLSTDEEAWFVLRADDDDVHPIEQYDSAHKLEATTRWWDAWSRALSYNGPYRREVERSALALKLCCYEPTGAIVAAPTTSLPEAAGAGRNWDYRYTWLRDSAFVLYALDLLGYHTEVNGFFKFLKRVRRRATDRHVQIMFGIDGRHELPEHVLAHLEGYAGARPVRVGNDAAHQFQLDVYGEMLETVEIWRRRYAMTEGIWAVMHDLVDWTASHWRDPDLSIWEPRQEARHFVFSKVMAWLALDRGARIAEELRLPGDAGRWRKEAQAARADVLEHGWDAARGTFVQAYGASDLDAAVLAIPRLGFLPPTDPRVTSTLAAVRRELATVCEDLIYRYRGADGLDGHEGAFVACSFWMIENLALTGQVAEAERLFRHLLNRANAVGLLAEEIDPATGAQMGNFPLALSHAALINAACTIERCRPHD